MSSESPPRPTGREKMRRHPLAHLWSTEPPPPAPPWLASARMIWHSDPKHVEDPTRPPEEPFNAAWSRLFGESWPEPAAELVPLERPQLTEIPDVEPAAAALVQVPIVEAHVEPIGGPLVAPRLDPIRKFETDDALYNLFPGGRIVIVYASSAMAICVTDIDAEAIPQPIGELEATVTEVDHRQLEAAPAPGDKPT